MIFFALQKSLFAVCEWNACFWSQNECVCVFVSKSKAKLTKWVKLFRCTKCNVTQKSLSWLSRHGADNFVTKTKLSALVLLYSHLAFMLYCDFVPSRVVQFKHIHKQSVYQCLIQFDGNVNILEWMGNLTMSSLSFCWLWNCRQTAFEQNPWRNFVCNSQYLSIRCDTEWEW